MQRNALRADRFTKAIGPELYSQLIEEWTSIGHDTPPRSTCFREVARACRRAAVPPEAMLIGVRFLSRSVFEKGTPESERIESAWHPAVRIMMDAYYAPETITRASIG